jgi:hypothetical protein
MEVEARIAADLIEHRLAIDLAGASPDLAIMGGHS